MLSKHTVNYHKSGMHLHGISGNFLKIGLFYAGFKRVFV